ncbi:MAG TPA: aldose epimerase family protein [Chitinophagaceae bacterium]|jgi:aldose 1-epimerase|nr:aldose epimerase family protein [Chitinophagaceae bacterium]
MTKDKAIHCFTDPSGKDVLLFTLQNSKGTEVMITNYGAIITSFIIRDEDGKTNDIVLGFDRIQDYFSADYLTEYSWFGAAVGRTANRIKGGHFRIDDQEYYLTRNRETSQLHGGDSGFDRKTWEFAGQGDSPQPWLRLNYCSPDGEEGFPGNLDVSILFELNDANELSYTYTAVTDKTTVVNLTHHSYFNLDNGNGTIEDHEIKIHASSLLEQDDDLVATGTILPVANTVFDFRNFTRIGNGLKEIGEYDKSFVVDQQGTNLVAEARSLRSGLQLQIFCNEPVVHFYSGKWIPEVKGKNDIMYGPFSGFCLETHKHPNAVNIPHFPNTILRPGETYHQKTLYKII